MSSTTISNSTSTVTPIFSEEVCYFKNPITKRRVVTNSNTHKKLALDGVAVPAYSCVKKARVTGITKKNVGKKAKISFCMSPENMKAFIMDIRQNIVTNKVFLKAVSKCQESLETKDEIPVQDVQQDLMPRKKVVVEKPSMYSNTEDLSESTSSDGEDSESGSESDRD